VISYYVSLRSEFRVVISYYVSLRSEFRVETWGELMCSRRVSDVIHLINRQDNTHYLQDKQGK
jgi:hypothetical protein